MKNLISICALLGFMMVSVASFSQDALFKEERPVSSFNAIDASGIARIYLTQGDQEKVVVEVNNRSLNDRLKIKVQNNTLQIKIQDGMNAHNQFKDAKVNIYVTYKELKSISGSGATSYKSEDPIKVTKLKVELSGANQTDLNLDVTELEFDVSGASNVELKGHADKFSINASGASHVRAFSLNAEDVQVETSGVANTQITAQKTIDINASGVSNLTYKGEAKVVGRDVSKMANAHKD